MTSGEEPNGATVDVLDRWFESLAGPDPTRGAAGRGPRSILKKQLSRAHTIRDLAIDIGYRATGELLVAELRKAMGR